MVVEILDLSTASSKDIRYNMEKVDLSKLILSTCEEMNIKGRKYNIKVQPKVQENIFIKGDNDKLREVLVNLIDNSIKYGNVNSTVEVEAYSEGEYIYLKVKDKGIGIEKEHLNNLFEPFYRISQKEAREKGSAGLGLSIVKNIVEKHNGCIDIKSNINEGTEVIVKFKGENYENLQLIQGEERCESRNIDITNISRSLKLLAKELDITVIALSQLSRAPEARNDHRPMLSDLRDSGAIEQDADIVMLLYRDAYYNSDSETKDLIECIIGKNRNGEVGTVKLKWKPEYQRIE